MKQMVDYMRNCMIIIIMCLWAGAVSSQTIEPNLKFGKPTEQELTMTSYPLDPDADAVMLYSGTETWYDVRGDEFILKTDVKVRIKVLRDEGKDYANIAIPYMSNEANRGGYKEQIRGLKVTSYNMENGQVVKTKMSSDMVFKESVDKDHMLLKFTVPQVKAGTVFEYQYTKESDYYFYIDTWYAQHEMPTLYSTYEVTIPEWFLFNVSETGFHKLESKREDTNFSLHIGGGDMRCLATRYIFTGKELPGLKDDDYIWAVSDYCDKVEAELSKIEVPGALYKNYTTTWDDIGMMLMDDSDFGGQLKRKNPLKEELASASIPASASPREKTAALFSLLKKHLKWNGKYALFGKGASEVKKTGEGTNADLNFVLLNMLNDMGMKAYPVVMRLRTQGRLPVTHPTVKDLSTFMVGVMETDSTMMLVDASADDGYIDVLPPRMLVSQARAITPDGKGFWVNPQQVSRSQINITAQVDLSDNGQLTGEARFVYEGNEAMTERQQYHAATDSTSFVKSKSEKCGVEITSFESSGMSSFSPQVRESIRFESHTDATADHIYLNPFLFRPLKESPFKAETRELPVEFSSLSSYTIRSVIKLPNGYVIDECPERMNLQTSDGGLSATIMVNASKGGIAVQMKLLVNKVLYSQLEYKELREFFDTFVKNCNGMVVLKRE